MRLLLWAAASSLLGILCLALGRRAVSASAWRHAGIQCIAWALVDAAIVFVAWRGVQPRDAIGAAHLDRVLWLNIGLDVGYAMVGATLVAFGLRAPRRLGLVGAGAAVILQGVVLAVLDGYLSAQLVQ